SYMKFWTPTNELGPPRRFRVTEAEVPTLRPCYLSTSVGHPRQTSVPFGKSCQHLGTPPSIRFRLKILTQCRKEKCVSLSCSCWSCRRFGWRRRNSAISAWNQHACQFHSASLKALICSA